MAILVTGGAGFIGANFVRHWLASSDEVVVNLDKLTYAGNLESLAPLVADGRHRFVQGDICDAELVGSLLESYRPWAIVHFAAESHVDRSILGPGEFVRTNIEGTFTLLECARAYWSGLEADARSAFRFLHVSTDEVYGSLSADEPPFAESHRYEPNSPYSASKAASDHLARAWHQTYGLPVLTTNCSNNYGPFQFPEKLIPLVIVNALAGKPLPIYGDGCQVRDWLYVGDHCAAIRTVLTSGQIGETYNVGGWNEKPNIEVVQSLCAMLDAERARVARQRAAPLLVEEALGGELGLEPVEGLEQAADPGRAQRLDAELVVAARLVQGDERACLDAHAVLGAEGEQLRAVAPHRAAHLGRGVLEGEVDMAGGGTDEVGDLAAHPHQGQRGFEQLTRHAVEFGDADDLRGGRRGAVRGQEGVRGHGRIVAESTGLRPCQGRARKSLIDKG